MTVLDLIYNKLPHKGAMRLLERVLDWDQEAIRCEILSHLSGDNPLRRAGVLASVHAVEYAAQAAAVHGVLCNVLDGGPILLLAAVRDLRLVVDRLDTLPAPLQICAVLHARSGPNAIYQFTLQSGDSPCAGGSLTLMQSGGLSL